MLSPNQPLLDTWFRRFLIAMGQNNKCGGGAVPAAAGKLTKRANAEEGSMEWVHKKNGVQSRDW